MIFGIDFDGTFTSDPELFKSIIKLMKKRGHECICVTARGDRAMYSDPTRHWGDEVREAVGDLMPIIFTNGDPKELTVINAGYMIDIWIDDDPMAIINGCHSAKMC